MIPLNYNEIKTGSKFEDLVVAYFEQLKKEKGTSIESVTVKPSGVGTDGGKDILVAFKISDSLTTFDRKWVIQCKFHKQNISPKQIVDQNITTLIQSFSANGYLLICRKKPTSKLAELFERLNLNCSFKLRYEIWSGEQFISKIMIYEELLQQFFPKYHAKYHSELGLKHKKKK